ncbi:MAG: PDZ domain-containing protein [Chromatiaceae bacterium]|jgi:predicted metalloprotease with PDZ domain|nr:PDZ domain-containing protein [Chromatiaceae bacterium]
MPPSFDLSYRVCPTSPEAHLFTVELEIARPPAVELRLDLPAWIPGSYMIRDFARNLVAIEADDAQGPVPIEKLDKQTWRLPVRGGSVRVRWRVYAWDLSVRGAHLDTSHAYFNGAALLLRVADLVDRPCHIALAPPPGEGYADWRVATSLAPLEAEPYGFGTYRADDYEDLIDHPVEMGCFTLVPFAVRGMPHALAITGRHRADEGRLQRDLTKVCEQHAALFDELPLDRYLFLTTVVGDGYGGLEHRFSTSLLASRADLPGPGDEAPSEGYRRFLGLASHEYFHLWHVKRIRPRALAEADLSRETHTRLLWAFEGITSYYDDLALVRSGVIDERAYLELLAQGITRVLRTPGRLVQTLAESSFDAWTKLYKADENAPNAIVSYYAKGALVALALDLTMRLGTDGARSLDHLMRALWGRHGRTGIGVEERGIEALAEEVSGLDLGAFFAQALDSTEDLDLAPLLAGFGIELRLRPARGPKDQGGVGNGEPAPARPPPTLGVRLQPAGSEPILQNVLTGSAAERAGLAPGDTLIAIDGLRVTRDNLDGLLARFPEGAEVRVHAFRRDELIEVRARPLPAPADTCELALMSNVPPAAERRAAWLGRNG